MLSFKKTVLMQRGKLPQGLLVTSLLLTGCAYSPFPPNTRPIPHTLCLGSNHTNACRPGSIDYALAYLDNTYEGYRQKLIEELELDNRVSNSLIGFGSLAAGFGLFSAHIDTIKATGLLAGTTYSLGDFNTNPTRREVYLEGMLAMYCAKKAVSPLINLSRDSEGLKQKEDALLGSLTEAGKALGNLLAAGAINGNTGNEDVLEQANQHVTDLQYATKEALNHLTAFAQLQTKSRSLGSILEAKIDEIRQTIDGKIYSETRQLKDVRKQLQELNNYVQVFVPGLDINQGLNSKLEALNEPTGKMKPPKNTQEAEGFVPQNLENVTTSASYLTGAISNAKAALVQLKSQIATLDVSIGTLFSDALNETEACGIKPSEKIVLTKPLKVTKTVSTIKSNKEHTVKIPISGGKPNYGFSLLDKPMTGLVVEIGKDNMLTIESNAKAISGEEYSIQIFDSSEPERQEVILLLKTSGGKVAAPDKVDASGEMATLCVNGDKLQKHQISDLQNRLKITVDNIFGPETCNALAKMLKNVGKLPPLIDVQKIYKALSLFVSNKSVPKET